MKPGAAIDPQTRAAASGIAALALRRLGGQTGDIAGAAEQAAEVAALVGLLIGAGTP